MFGHVVPLLYEVGCCNTDAGREGGNMEGQQELWYSNLLAVISLGWGIDRIYLEEISS
jgi:hypothetical protein